MEYQLHYKNISINFLNYLIIICFIILCCLDSTCTTYIQYILITSFTALSLIKGYQYEYCIYVIKYGILSSYWPISQNKRKTSYNQLFLLRNTNTLEESDT